jgi:WXG100 family type VII secretion target
MANIVANTGSIQTTSSQFFQKQQELEGLINQAKSQMASLEAEFKGTRATRIQGEWQQMQPQLVKAIESLKTAGDLLKRAALAFEDVDNQI